MSKRLRDNYNVRIKQPIDTRFTSNDGSDIDRPYEGLLSFFNDGKFHYYNNGQYYGLLDGVESEISAIDSKINNNVSINVKTLGAKGDGTTDDTTAIQNAVTLCNAKGYNLYFPTGLYKITSTITITANGILVYGDGKENSKLRFVGCDGIQLSSYYSGVRNISLYSDTNTKTGIAMLSKAYNIVENVFFRGYSQSTNFWNKCIYMEEVWYSIVKNCDFIGGIGHSNFNGYGVYVDYSVNNKIVQCNFDALNTGVFITNNYSPVSNIKAEGFTISHNLFIESTNGVYAQIGTWLDVSNNIIDQMTTIGVNFYNVTGGTIQNNWFNIYPDNVNAICINVLSSNTITIDNNTLYSQYTDILYGIKVDVGSSANTITNNKISTFKTGIDVQGDSNVINGNIITNATTCDINIGGDYNNIQGNVLRNNNLTIASSKVNNISQRDTYNNNFTITLNSESTKIIDVALPSNWFSNKPKTAILQSADANISFIARYMYNDSNTTKSNARFTIQPLSGTFPASTTISVNALFMK